MLQRAPFSQPLVHFGGEEPDRPAAFGLCPIKSRVRITHQRHRVRAVGRENCHSDAKADPKLVACNIEVVCNDCKQALRERFGSRWLGTFRDQRKLVTTKTREKSVFSGRVQPAREFMQQRVTDRVPKYIIDLLEAIEIDAQHRKVCFARCRSFESESKMLCKSSAVRQIG